MKEQQQLLCVQVFPFQFMKTGPTGAQIKPLTQMSPKTKITTEIFHVSHKIQVPFININLVLV